VPRREGWAGLRPPPGHEREVPRPAPHRRRPGWLRGLRFGGRDLVRCRRERPSAASRRWGSARGRARPRRRRRVAARTVGAARRRARQRGWSAPAHGRWDGARGRGRALERRLGRAPAARCSSCGARGGRSVDHRRRASLAVTGHGRDRRHRRVGRAGAGRMTGGGLRVVGRGRESRRRRVGRAGVGWRRGGGPGVVGRARDARRRRVLWSAARQGRASWGKGGRPGVVARGRDGRRRRVGRAGVDWARDGRRVGYRRWSRAGLVTAGG
jgi:hypothetical protein